ncbi:F-box/FBD/LRR-repeat protein At1g16930-like [Chenopodium quinoa]|uniref:F-box/FBD/LRR-repeat protein At1g16930-like n=1 Tax=Chenopodium quinoa TaxID=63459 RepID=UPI000B77E02E|nr:F-box/FBD/LRR-repeat protein At1g16930-like [Chenopodium quinoa]
MKYLWTLVTTLELVDFKDERPEKFDGFVSHVLQHCKSINLEKFRLACRESRDLCLIDDWISSAVSRKPKQLILDLFGDTINFREIVLSSYPTCSITYNTIVILKLKSCFEIEIPESLASFPCLKILQFTGWFPYENHCSALDRLLSNSPVLEDLHLEGYLESEAEFEFDLCVPTLKRLRLNLKTDVHGVHPHTVTIDAPKLEDFDIADGTCAEYVMKNVGSLDFVDVDYEASWTDVPEDDHIRRLLGLLFGIAKTKELSISVDSLLNLKSSVSRPWPQFSHFDGVGVGEYLLKNGQVLQAMVITTDPYPLDDEMEEEILMFDTASETCEVHVYEKVKRKLSEKDLDLLEVLFDGDFQHIRSI